VDRGFELVEDRSDAVIAALRAACPSFDPRWRAYMARRRDEPVSRYSELWEFAQHLVDLLVRQETAEFPAVFGAVERLMVGDEVGVRDLITVGLVEDLQSLALDLNDSLADGFRPWLGPLTAATWDRVHRFWGTDDGGAPVASDARVNGTAIGRAAMPNRSMQDLEPGEWLVSLSAWVIQDGNYGDFTVGERQRFALEYLEGSLRRIHEGRRSAIPTFDRAIHTGYHVSARVAVAVPDLMILDFGLLAYSERHPPVRLTGPIESIDAPAGAWVAGAIVLAVDYYAYMEIYGKRRGVPPAVYTWTITGIWRQKGPWSGSLAEQVGFHPVSSTNAWADDGLYILRCRVEPDAPLYEP
jgi:hypothetical protein